MGINTNSSFYDSKKDFIVPPVEKAPLSVSDYDLPLSDPTNTDEEDKKPFSLNVWSEKVYKRVNKHKTKTDIEMPVFKKMKYFEKQNELREPTINIKDQNKPIWETASYIRIKDYNCFSNITLLLFLGPYLVSAESYLLSLNYLIIHWSKTQIFRILNRLGLTFSFYLDELMENDTLNENLTKNNIKLILKLTKNIVELKKIKTKTK